MFSVNFQNSLPDSILPYIRLKFPDSHRFFMDNDPKHTSHSARRFIILNNINHFKTKYFLIVGRGITEIFF